MERVAADTHIIGTFIQGNYFAVGSRITRNNKSTRRLLGAVDAHTVATADSGGFVAAMEIDLCIFGRDGSRSVCQINGVRISGGIAGLGRRKQRQAARAHHRDDHNHGRGKG